MRTKIVAGNWKMNTTLADAHILASGVLDGMEHIERITTVLFPPTLWVTDICHEIIPVGKFPHLKLGVQNIYYEDKGSFTGEVSPAMVKEVAEYVLVGHSEQVHIFHEGPDMLNRKVLAALRYGLTPILCIGEDVQSDSSKQVLTGRLHRLTEGLESADLERLVVAYEPVWAIGSGNPATPEYAEEMIAHLRGSLTPETRILYGGSVTEENDLGFLGQSNIDGFLIGGTSLKLKPFLTVCQHADDTAQQQGHRSLHPANHIDHA